MTDDHDGEGKGYSPAVRIAFFLTMWYLCSGVTLFGNKHIMNHLGCDPNVLAMSQMVSTASFGALKMYGPYLVGGKPQLSPLSSQPWRNFVFDMLLVGVMRFATIMAGLLSLKFVAVSFTETIKSSAPFFTVIFARIILGERTSLMVNLSLLPVVGGLALCSATELSFNYVSQWCSLDRSMSASVLASCCFSKPSDSRARLPDFVGPAHRHSCTDWLLRRNFQQRN